MNESSLFEDLAITCQLLESPGRRRVAVVRLEGEFDHHGSLLVDAIDSLQCQAADELAVVLDFRALKYDGGDDMWNPVQHAKAIVYGEDSRISLKTLFEDDGGCADWLATGLFFDDIDSAVEYARRP